MKSLSIIIIQFFFLSHVSAQLDIKKYSMEEFLIGTLYEYQGYNRISIEPNPKNYNEKVDVYLEKDLNLAIMIDSIFNKKYNDIKIFKDDRTAYRYSIYSKKLSKLIDSYFHYELIPNETTGNGNEIFIGKHKIENYKSEKSKVSFLLGMFVKDGEFTTIDTINTNTNRIINFNLFNAKNKTNFALELLKYLGCQIDTVKTNSKGIPKPYVLSFIASKKIKSVIKDAQNIRKQLSQKNCGNLVFTLNDQKYQLWSKDLEVD